MKNKKRILLATNHSYMFFRFRKQLVQALQEDYEVVISTPFTGHEDDFRSLGLEIMDIKLSRRSINPKDDLRLIRQYQTLLEEIKPDIVVTYSIKPNVYLSRLCASRKIPYFCHIQGLGTAFQTPGIRSLAKILYKNGLKNAEDVFFENSSNLKFFKDQNIVPEGKGILLPGAGVSLTEFQYCEKCNSDQFHILYLGRFMKEKGMDELLDALHKLHDSGASFHFDFAGFCEDSYQEKLSHIVNEGWGTDHGFVNDPRELYKNSDCVVLPSWHEGMSNVLLEAACIGRPVITTRIPGCMEAVEDGITGYLVETKNSADLYKALTKMMSLSEEERKKMGKAAHIKMRNEFSRRLVVEKTISVIKKATD